MEAEIQNEAKLFYLGGYGRFDHLAASVVWELKQKYQHIKSVLVLAYLNREVDMKYYDETIYPALEAVPPRYAIIKRNEWMVREAETVIAYVLYGWGGAAQTLKFAQSRNKRILRYSPQPKKQLRP